MQSKNEISASDWWSEVGGFFGAKYIEGDDSYEGYIPGKAETLEERTKREVEGIFKLLNLRENKRKAGILDIPCGYGRHSIGLVKNFDCVDYVIGLDINREHISKANEGKNEFLHESGFSHARLFFGIQNMMNELPQAYKGSFDAVINMFYSFGFFKTDEENEKVMKNFYDALAKNGQLLLHSDVSPEIIETGEYKFHEERKLRNGKKLRINESYDPQTRRINGLWTIVGQDGSEDLLTPYSVRIYSKEEFEKIARKVGFGEIRFYGSFEGEKFSKISKEIILVARKAS